MNGYFMYHFFTYLSISNILQSEYSEKKRLQKNSRIQPHCILYLNIQYKNNKINFTYNSCHGEEKIARAILEFRKLEAKQQCH